MSATKTRPAAELRADLIAQLRESNTLDALRAGEADAVITHFLQSINHDAPLLDPALRKKFCEHIGRPLPAKARATKRSSAREEAEPYQASLDLGWDVPYPPPSTYDFTFIDLFAGIGGFRLAFEKAGGKCVFTSEWDKYAKKTYEANFGEVPYGDIRNVDKASIPDHDVLCAGFPCQPFSIAGVSKKNSLGREHGFKDETQGTLFFEIKEILRLKRPKAFMLENVKNLLTHDGHRTFRVIKDALEQDLGYVINWKIVDGAKWVPQHRERIFIVGFDPQQVEAPSGGPLSKEDIVIPTSPINGHRPKQLSEIIKKSVKGYTLGPGTWATLERHKAHHAASGNGFGYGIHELPIAKDAVTRTISARYHKDGAEVLIRQKNEIPRRLTVEEAMQLQGYNPDRFRLVGVVSNTQAYRQIGNSVVVPAITDCALELAHVLTGGKDGRRKNNKK